MEIRIKQSLYNIKNSLWFLPSLMAVSAVVLAFGFVELDSRITYDDFPIGWFVYGGQPDGARSVLSTIASSMVTITGVTFSITLVALTMASSQFGPRLLRNFIADKGNQFVIGALISTFIYSLIVLLAIRGSADDEFVPKISVVFAFLLAIFSLGIIIYFIHHVTTSIQADFIIKSSFQEFKKVTGGLLVDEREETAQSTLAEHRAEVKEKYVLSTTVCFEKSGYIQTVDYKSSCKWARDHHAVIEWLIYPGVFATLHDSFAVIHHKSSLPETAAKMLQKFVVIAYQRTPNQDLLFSLKQIVEVGVRALSPGTNDPHTAVSCIHWLGAALSELAQKSFDSPVLTDSDQSIRVLRKQIDFEMIVDTCFDHLRLYAGGNMYVTAELLLAIEKPLVQTKNNEFRLALKEKATIIYNNSRKAFGSELPRKMDVHYQKIMQY